MDQEQLISQRSITAQPEIEVIDMEQPTPNFKITNLSPSKKIDQIQQPRQTFSRLSQNQGSQKNLKSSLAQTQKIKPLSTNRSSKIDLKKFSQQDVEARKIGERLHKEQDA